MTIPDLIKAIKEENLTQQQLEAYYDQLVYLSVEMELKCAELEKEESLYLANSPEETKAGADRKWNATESGLELRKLKRHLRAVDKLAASVKRRTYKFI